MSRPPAPEPLTVPVIDTHCHLDLSADDDPPVSVADAVAAAAAVGVRGIVQVGCDLAGARWAVQAARAHPAVRAAVALHPNEAPRIAARGGPAALSTALADLADLAARPEVVAVGETGLDHYRTGPQGRAVQEESFRRHLRLARDLGKPLVIHDRDAHDDVLRVLAEEQPPATVVFHCFSGDARMAAYVAERGWYLSFAGVVTFRNAADLRAALAVPPADLLLVETDAPYLTPAPFRGRQNASYLLPWTVRAMAQVRGVPEPDLAAVLDRNAERVFGPWP